MKGGMPVHKNKGILRSLLTGIILSSLCLSGCMLVPEAFLPDHKIQINVRSAAILNPDEAGNPNPLTLKVYELTSPDAFQEVDFIPLFKNPKEVLGNEMVGQEQIIQIRPNYKLAIKFTAKREAKYLGVVAAYQNIQAAEWRLLIPLNSNWGAESKWIRATKLSIVQEN
jgi:type VI secretion system protein VasD